MNPISTLKEGIDCRGAQYLDYRDVWGQEGAPKRLKVYRRKVLIVCGAAQSGARWLPAAVAILPCIPAGRWEYECNRFDGRNSMR